MESIVKYAYEIYKKGSFTKAAKSLYISQPSLSAAISRLEGDLGFRIFDRSTVPCSLTPEGKIYIEGIEEIIEVENNVQRRIRSYRDGHQRSISVGGGSFASYLILSEICSAFFKRYPEINVTLDIGNIGTQINLMEKIENRELDILITYTNSHPGLIIEPILEERMVIAMHKDMLKSKVVENLALTGEEILSKSYSPDREIEDMSIFSDVEFLEFPPKSDTHQRMTKILGNYKVSRYKIDNARHSEMHYNLMCAGIGAVLTTTLAIEQKPYDENILFFVPKSEESHRKIYLAYNYLSRNDPLIKSFIEVAKNIYSSK